MEKHQFTEQELEMLCEYMHRTDNVESNLWRAKYLGITAPEVKVAPGAIIRIPLEQIGEGAFIGLYSYINGNVIIGKRVLIGPHCSIVASHHKYNPATGWFSSRIGEAEEGNVIIGDGSWLASNVTITAGVKIGKANLICAGAVVTKSTEDFAIMAGVPAKQIGRIDPVTGEYCWLHDGSIAE